MRDWGAACDGTADDSAAVAAAAAALRGTGASLHVPADCRLRLGSGAQVVLDGVGLAGDGTRDGGVPYGGRGGTVLLTDASRAPIVVKRGWTLRGLAFFWPGQVEDAGAPRSYPPLLTGVGAGTGGADEVTQGRFEDNDVVNAWRVMDFASDVSGGLQVRGNRMWCLDACVRLSSMPVESFFSDNQVTRNAYSGAGAGPTHRLRDQAARNAAVFDIVGDGTAAARSARSVDGLQVSNNYVFGMGYGVRVRGGTLDVSALTGNSFDAVGRVLSVEAGGLVSGVRVVGGMWLSNTDADPTVSTPAVYAAPDAAPDNNLHLGAVSALGATGSLVDWNAPGSTLTLSDVETRGLNRLAGGTASGVRFNSAGGRLQVLGGTLVMQGASPGPCIEVVQPVQVLTVVGTNFVACGAPISISGASGPGAAMVAGNASVGTHGASAYAGARAASLPDIGNAWDKPTPGWSQVARGADGATVFSFGGVPKLSILPNGDVRAAGTVTGRVAP